MNKLVALASTAALLSAFAMPTMAADNAAEKKAKTPEEMCKAQAEKDKVSADKMEAYIKTCVEKHTAGKTAPAKPAGK